MITLEAEYIAGRGAGGRKLPTAAVGELESGARVGTGTGTDVPLVGHRNLFRERQCYRPAGQSSRTGVGDTHVHLKESTSRIGRRRGTTVCGVCLTAQQ
jgi:hypothetical protein